MYATLLFDVEDLVITESNDIVKWLAEILHEEGLKGTFPVVAEKTCLLEARGRFDVLEALNRHDLGSHTDTHSVHSAVSEYLADKDWDGGVKEAYEREVRGFKDLERIFDKGMPSLGQPGWVIHKPDLNQRKIVRYTKLQTWTLKPAHRHE